MSSKIETRPRSKSDRMMRDGMMEIFPRVRPGTKVRMIGLYEQPGVNCPQVGKVYTVRELRRGLWTAWAVGFTLVEVTNDIDAERGSEPFWPANMFQLLEDEADYRKFINQVKHGHDWPN